MPVAPPELVVEFTIEPSRESAQGPQATVEAGREAADASGLAREAGPDELALAGGRAEVLETLFEVIEASLDAGARTVRIKLEVPEARQS
jgi:hypothetical protein